MRYNIFLLIALISLIQSNNFLSLLEDLDIRNIKQELRNRRKVSKKSPRSSNGNLPPFVNIARKYGAGCYVNSNEEVDCVFPSYDDLNKGYNEISKQIDFDDKEKVNGVVIQYIAYSPTKVVLRTCLHLFMSYYLDRIDNKFNVITDVTCRNNFKSCPIQPEVECEMSGDCLKDAKKRYSNQINLPLLDQYPKLEVPEAAKSNYKNISIALEDFSKAIKKDIASNACKAFTQAMCMSIGVKKSGSDQKSDEVHHFTPAQADQSLKSC